MISPGDATHADRGSAPRSLLGVHRVRPGLVRDPARGERDRHPGASGASPPCPTSTRAHARRLVLRPKQFAKSLKTKAADGEILISDLADTMDKLIASTEGAIQLERNPFKCVAWRAWRPGGASD